MQVADALATPNRSRRLCGPGLVGHSRRTSLPVDAGGPDGAFEVEAARVMATRAALTNAEVNVQNHGGIGFTWEHPAHRYVTRARLLELTGGSLADHQAKLLTAPTPAG